MNRRYFVLALAVFTVVPHASAQSSEAEAAIRETIVQYQDGVREQDADKTADAFTSDAVFMPNAAPASVGREKIRATLASTYVDGSNRGFTMTPSEITVKGDWAIARTDNSGETKTADGWQQIDTKSFFLLSRAGQDGWKIYRYMWNPNQP